ncbi:hypothetical protein BJ508DRAFT_410689 [Ascobolus immersus RN42]|uniref:Fatty acid hydroxylase domain-containing protein n=1 Tax=Ascobolus immersus RN42 TaxID=1160509 RepID=A0A3N4ILZ2_ASCIM|nr:hypothetical protein BJ508DRAFT_410689 [Ascobolus immersus RN42]
MDIVLSVLDTLVFDRIYATVLPLGIDVGGVAGKVGGAVNGTTPFGVVHERDPISEYFGVFPSNYADLSMLSRGDWRRQLFSLFLITWIFGVLLYFIGSLFSYVFIFDKRTFDHPKFLKNQIRQEIATTMKSLPFMAILTAPFFFIEIRGYSKLYYNLSDMPTWYNFFQFPFFLFFTDGLIYFIHRGLHHGSVYKTLHKPHHKWIMPTPFASHAFHPVDGFAQSLPYHIFPFLFPLHKFGYIGLFIFVNCWTILIHDGEFVADHPAINGAACHTYHHLYFNYNYGQFTTFWDRIGGSYRRPDAALFDKEQRMAKEQWKKQVGEMETIVKAVEGDDGYREYAHDNKKTI